MAKRTYYLEVEDNKMVYGEFLCKTAKMTEKQVLKYAERIARDFFKYNPENCGRGFYEINICTDEDCLDAIFSVGVFAFNRRKHCIHIYDYTTKEFIRFD